MISDAEFWMEIRRKQGGGDTIFRSMLAVLHARQAALDPRTSSLDREEFALTVAGKERRDQADGKYPSSDEKRVAEEAKKRKEKELKELEKPLEENKALRLPLTQQSNAPPPRRVAAISIRVLQQIMMFAVPVYALRYNIPAMSMSWNTSCFIDRPTKQLITFGAGQGVKVPQLLHGRGCVAGDGFFAILSDCDEVWASGGLKVSSSSVSGPTPLGREEAMTGIAAKTLMLVGHGQRLASVTRAFTVRSLSALSNPTRSIIPSRHVRFLDLGYGEDYYMIGTDSIVYKTTASKRAVSTPRRVMTLSRMSVSRIASGTSFLLIIDQSGHLYSMGRNRKGQLGNGERQDARRKPYYQDSLSHHFFTQVAAGDCHSLALTSSGVVYGAGSNESGQLGLGPDMKEVLVFTPISLHARCVGIAAGPAGSMFAMEDGQVLSCGLNDCMQLGVESAQKIVYEPTPIAILASGVESYTMDFGGFHCPGGTEDTEGGTASNDAASIPTSTTPGPAENLGKQTIGDAANQLGASPGAPKDWRDAGGSSGINNIQHSNNRANHNAMDSDGNNELAAIGHSVIMSDATVVVVDNDPVDDVAGPGENHEPAAGSGVKGAKDEKTRNTKKHGSKPKVKKTDGGCKCCSVM